MQNWHDPVIAMSGWADIRKIGRYSSLLLVKIFNSHYLFNTTDHQFSLVTERKLRRQMINYLNLTVS